MNYRIKVTNSCKNHDWHAIDNGHTDTLFNHLGYWSKNTFTLKKGRQ
ncbi:hypothetical protein QQ020_20485 [Fulvivirgaceae bacterium BMA12]|uniref:Uncharacterized protein n=1 Tax=Agaribacillus aureus TaxID=3051825 RepID=A0ABT8L9P6_9BACT|nr:hypothetical protein [Fulvivirgaceae bacterium BMA12]